MGKIKSALELAMEKTADLQVDKAALKKNELTREGKISASGHLDNPAKSELKDRLKSYKGEEQKWFLNGAVETVLANLTLPRVEADLNRLAPLAETLILLKGDKRQVNGLFDQLRQLFEQYLANMDHLEEGLKQQYEPQLRQKEMQLRQQTGQEVRLSPENDPDFMKLLAEQYGRMEQQYEEVLKQAKDELRNP